MGLLTVVVGGGALMVPHEGLVEGFGHVLVAYGGVGGGSGLAEREQLILPLADVEQGRPAPVVDIDHHLVAAAVAVLEEGGLGTAELSLGDTHPVALHQPRRVGRAEWHHARVGVGYPLQEFYMLIGDVGEVVAAIGLLFATQEVVLWFESYGIYWLINQGVMICDYVMRQICIIYRDKIVIFSVKNTKHIL